MPDWILIAAALVAALAAVRLLHRPRPRDWRPPFTALRDEWGAEEWWLDTGPRANGGGPTLWGRHHR